MTAEIARTMSEHRLTWWAVFPWNGGHEVAPRCTCGVLWSAGQRADLDAQTVLWEAHVAEQIAQSLPPDPERAGGVS